MVIVNIFDYDKYRGRYQLDRLCNKIIWRYIFETSTELDQSYPSLDLKRPKTDDNHGFTFTYIPFKESDLDDLK